MWQHYKHINKNGYTNEDMLQATNIPIMRSITTVMDAQTTEDMLRFLNIPTTNLVTVMLEHEMYFTDLVL